jgi:ketosteroid isomerase-like protein
MPADTETGTAAVPNRQVSQSRWRRDTARAMSQENVEIVRREYEFFNRTGELTAERYHPEFEFHDFEGAPQPVRRGFEEWRNWARDVAEAFGEFVLEPQELVDVGEQVVAVVLMRGRGKGSDVNLQHLQTPFAVVWTLRDGKVIRGAVFRSKSEALEAVGLSE